jgi:hypothetical protein
MRTGLVSASLVLATAACGSNGLVGNTGSGAAGATTSTTSSGTSSGAGGSQGETVTLTMDTFTIPAGGEVYYCQNFANPFGGMDVEVSEFESHMATGSHHLLVFFEDSTSMSYMPQGGPAKSALETCSGLEFAATPYGSQQENDSLSFPPGVAALMPGANSLRFQSHYLNTTGASITAHVEVIFHLAAPGSVMNQAGVLFGIDPKFKILPQSSAIVMDDCTLPQDMTLLRTQSHMHRHGTHFLATIAGATVYETSQWSDPKPDIFSPPQVYHQGDALHFECAFTNTGSTPLVFGESAITNEMCIFNGAFYPVVAGQNLIGGANCVMTQM